jgi:hypothetical protein
MALIRQVGLGYQYQEALNGWVLTYSHLSLPEKTYLSNKLRLTEEKLIELLQSFGAKVKENKEQGLAPRYVFDSEEKAVAAMMALRMMKR